jgi:hypothetical protein
LEWQLPQDQEIWVQTPPGTNVMIFKNIFAEKICEKIGIFDSKQS